jgi:hypothetical protein
MPAADNATPPPADNAPPIPNPDVPLNMPISPNVPGDVNAMQNGIANAPALTPDNSVPVAAGGNPAVASDAPNAAQGAVPAAAQPDATQPDSGIDPKGPYGNCKKLASQAMKECIGGIHNMILNGDGAMPGNPGVIGAAAGVDAIDPNNLPGSTWGVGGTVPPGYVQIASGEYIKQSTLKDLWGPAADPSNVALCQNRTTWCVVNDTPPQAAAAAAENQPPAAAPASPAPVNTNMQPSQFNLNGQPSGQIPSMGTP